MRVVRHLSAKHRACTKCACLKNVAMITHPSLHNRNDHPHPFLHSRYHHPSHPLQNLRSCPTRTHSCREHPADAYTCLSHGSSSKQSRVRVPGALYKSIFFIFQFVSYFAVASLRDYCDAAFELRHVRCLTRTANIRSNQELAHPSRSSAYRNIF